MTRNAVLCVACGYHLRIKQHLHGVNSNVTALPDDDNPYRSPGTQFSNGPDDELVRASLGSTLFRMLTPQGRVPRSYWWMAQVGYFVAMALLDPRVVRSVIPEHAVVAFVCVAVWVMLMVQIKRWHDIDKSGFWCLIVLIPCVGPIWALIELGFEDGTVGPNAYGDDPLAR